MPAELTEESSDADSLADRAITLVEETTQVLSALALTEPHMATALARHLYDRVSGKSKSTINTTAKKPSENNDTPNLIDVSFIETSDSEIKSLLKPSDIDQRSLRNRKLRGSLFDDIILLLLLANAERSLVATDVKQEFVRLQIDVAEPTLLSRISRLREAKAVDPVSATGAGLYRLSTDGQKIAQAAREKRMAGAK